MDFLDLARLGAEPSPTHLGSFVVEHLERHGPGRRGDLIDAARKAWSDAGGAPMKADLVARMKKALQMLAAQGTVEQSGAYGIWLLTEQSEVAQAMRDDQRVGIPDEPVDDVDAFGIADRVVGSGHQQVYCFYLDTYRELALARGEERWPIKIGMTAGQLSSRMQAHATALPEAPHLALVLCADSAATLEKVIHGVLSLRGRRTEDSGGTEWFTTTPDEIERIYHEVLGLPASAN